MVDSHALQDLSIEWHQILKERKALADELIARDEEIQTRMAAVAKFAQSLQEYNRATAPALRVKAAPPPPKSRAYTLRESVARSYSAIDNTGLKLTGPYWKYVKSTAWLMFCLVLIIIVLQFSTH